MAASTADDQRRLDHSREHCVPQPASLANAVPAPPRLEARIARLRPLQPRLLITGSMKTAWPIWVGCIAAVVAGAAPITDSPHAADVAAIEAFNAQYLQAINAGDVAALSGLTDDDHIMIAPNRKPIEGKEANDRANRLGFQQLKIAEAWTPLETVVDGNLAYQRGIFTVVATPRGGGTSRTTRGNFLRIYRRQADGTWRMSRDMFNADTPQDDPSNTPCNCQH
jgi:ketosteroid isomerase-like protein